MNRIPCLEIAWAPGAPAPRARIILGMPGTVGGLKLRVGQFFLAAITLSIMATSSDMPRVTAFRVIDFVRFAVAATAFQCLWSFSLALADAHALLQGRLFQDKRLLIFFFIGDAVTTILIGFAALGIMGIISVINDDNGNCSQSSCANFLFAASVGLVSWTAAAISFFADMVVLAQG